MFADHTPVYNPRTARRSQDFQGHDGRVFAALPQPWSHAKLHAVGKIVWYGGRCDRAKTQTTAAYSRGYDFRRDCPFRWGVGRYGRSVRPVIAAWIVPGREGWLLSKLVSDVCCALQRAGTAGQGLCVRAMHSEVVGLPAFGLLGAGRALRRRQAVRAGEVSLRAGGTRLSGQARVWAAFWLLHAAGPAAIEPTSEPTGRACRGGFEC